MKINSTRLLLALFASSIVATLHGETPNPYAPLNYIPRGTKGQAIVDMEMEKHPELKLIAIHVTYPGIPISLATDTKGKGSWFHRGGLFMMFSSFGKIGKPDNKGDMAWFASEKVKILLLKEEPPGNLWYRVTAHPKYNVQEPIYTKSGQLAGWVGVAFPYAEGDDLTKYDAITHSICEDIKARIADKDELYDPAA
ncbi:MAG: hypothetical protein JWM32_1043 [Verrucomicrobia bacterium]|nr:hypothetical protein [Verrucomicrobiota bacterium]